MLRISLDTLIAEHGSWKVVRTALMAMVRRRAPRPLLQAQILPDYLRRDIGLSPQAPPLVHTTMRW